LFRPLAENLSFCPVFFRDTNMITKTNREFERRIWTLLLKQFFKKLKK
jgi:hypothetical protein